MSGREAMAHYCKAQAQLNKLEKETGDARRTLNERIRTYRSLLQDELSKKKLTCVEMEQGEGAEPVYVRLKTPTTSPTVDAELVMGILTKVDTTTLGEVAEKHGHDLPKMLSMILTTTIRTSYTKPSNKTTLTISNAKERGFRQQAEVPNEVRQLASDLLKARTELSNLRKQQKTTSKPIVEEQKMVEETVKEALKTSDPVNMTTRVHMMQEGDEWVYFLRCKEKEVAPTIGIRKVVPLVEAALVKTLHDAGMGREYSASFKMGQAFWETFRKHFQATMDLARQQTKTSSRLTLDRGAPRRARSQTARE